MGGKEGVISLDGASGRMLQKMIPPVYVGSTNFMNDVGKPGEGNEGGFDQNHPHFK